MKRIRYRRTNGIINVNSKRGRTFGFTSDKFHKDSYLWEFPDAIRVCFIVSKVRGRGDFRALIEAIHAKGFVAEVVNPLRQMEEICRKNGYTQRFEKDDFCEPVAIWSLPLPSSAEKAA